jgi:hypothetical protein
MLMIFLHAMFTVISSHGLLIICTAETHRKKSHRRNVLLTFYKMPYKVQASLVIRDLTFRVFAITRFTGKKT